ncbi:hypothetical protein [Streptomyces lomondensis]|nr:hypothetical protein [Streptomyces lomondensis]
MVERLRASAPAAVAELVAQPGPDEIVPRLVALTAAVVRVTRNPR